MSKVGWGKARELASDNVARLADEKVFTVPEGTKLIKTTTKEGICYIDFNSSFLNKRAGLSDEVAVYSIVNSLAELSTVSKVQFTIDGVSVEKYGDGMVFDGIFERNLDIVTTRDM